MSYRRDDSAANGADITNMIALTTNAATPGMPLAPEEAVFLLCMILEQEKSAIGLNLSITLPRRQTDGFLIEPCDLYAKTGFQHLEHRFRFTNLELAPDSQVSYCRVINTK